ncbi:CoA-binding protein [Streptomyces sp. NPDC051684]|uniref:CoA-binding protein n=1 Tax=Streptomyces sp. NPDC051684 TaxID=3365670 RepID=UPI0037973AAE
MTTRRTLDVFRTPRSVAVVGATDNPAKWGHWLARGALAGRHRRRVHLVNARGARVLGQPSHPSLDSLPEVPDLVAFAVPAAALATGVGHAVALGTPGLLAVTSGIEDPAALTRTVRAGGSRLVGPNCLGLYDASAELELAWGRFTAGSLAVVSQSGQVGLEIAQLAAAAGVGVSRFVSVGSQLDVDAAEVLADLVDHDATRAVALYLESYGDGGSLLDALAALREAGKPVLLLTVGASTAARRAARSHTGAMGSSLRTAAGRVPWRRTPPRDSAWRSRGSRPPSAVTSGVICRRTPDGRTPWTSTARASGTCRRTPRSPRAWRRRRSPTRSCSADTSAATAGTSPRKRRLSPPRRVPSAASPWTGRCPSSCTPWPNTPR